jgi:hypothetical protein
MNSFDYRNPKFLAILCLTGSLLPLTGCSGNFQSSEKVNEPPFIPAVEAPTPPQENEEIPALSIGAYADLMDYGDQTRHNPKLVEAVSHAIQLGVLEPNGVNDRFNPDNPISFSEFRQWATTYQAAENASILKPAHSTLLNHAALNHEATEEATKNSSKALLPVAAQPEALTSPINPAKLTILPTLLQFGAHALENNRPLNREELCALYVFLSKKQQQASALTPDQIENTAPGTDTVPNDETFSMFKDYTAISNWAKPYVAIAYQDGILQKVFKLSGTQLTIDQGFNPLGTIDREEAILLLNQLFGHVKTPAPKTKPAQKAPPQKDSVSTDSGMRGHYLPETTMPQTTAPEPLKSLKTVTEKGPNGSRTVQRTEQAE